MTGDDWDRLGTTGKLVLIKNLKTLQEVFGKRFQYINVDVGSTDTVWPEPSRRGLLQITLGRLISYGSPRPAVGDDIGHQGEFLVVGIRAIQILNNRIVV